AWGRAAAEAGMASANMNAANGKYRIPRQKKLVTCTCSKIRRKSPFVRLWQPRIIVSGAAPERPTERWGCWLDALGRRW
ncbi:MAG: hypothetical protein WBQ52_04155, partial [Terracidiphilus sp.]